MDFSMTCGGRTQGLIAWAIVTALAGVTLTVRADPKKDNGHRPEHAEQKDKGKDHDNGRSDHDRGKGNDKDKPDLHDRGLHLGHYKNGKAGEEPATRPQTPGQPVTAPTAPGQPAPAQPGPAVTPVEPVPTEAASTPATAAQLRQLIRELRAAAKERDEALDEAYTVATKEHRPTKFKERKEKILNRYDVLVLRLLDREDLVAGLAEKELPDRREAANRETVSRETPTREAAKPVAQKPEVSKGSSKNELEASRDVIDLRAKLRRIEAAIADEKDESADRLDALQAARKRFEFNRDVDEVRRIDALIAVEREETGKQLNALERQRNTTATALVRAQKALAEIRRDHEDDDSARRRVADVNQRLSERRQRIVDAD